MPVAMGSSVKLDRIDDDAEDERDKEVMCDCFFPQNKVSTGSSPWRRRRKCEVRQDSFDKEHIVVAESDAIHVLCSVGSFKTAREGLCKPVRESSVTVVSIRSPSLVVLRLWSVAIQARQFICAGCLRMAGIERWESHECIKPGPLREDCSVHKQRIVENGNRPKGERFETTAVVRQVMVQTWKCDKEDYVFVFGNEVIADVHLDQHVVLFTCLS